MRAASKATTPKPLKLLLPREERNKATLDDGRDSCVGDCREPGQPASNQSWWITKERSETPILAGGLSLMGHAGLGPPGGCVHDVCNVRCFGGVELVVSDCMCRAWCLPCHPSVSCSGHDSPVAAGRRSPAAYCQPKRVQRHVHLTLLLTIPRGRHPPAHARRPAMHSLARSPCQSVDPHPFFEESCCSCLLPSELGPATLQWHMQQAGETQHNITALWPQLRP